jgi:type VI secretion system protein ImpB
MATKESSQHKLDRVRKPRVQITYDVEIGDAIETKELPFVLGVLGDLSGTNKAQPKLKDRKFIDVDRDNFDDVLKGVGPQLTMQVDNKLKADDESRLALSLKFNRLDDFEPQNVVRQVAPLNELLEVRKRLSDLRNKMIGNDKLDELLADVVRDSDRLQQLRQDQHNAQEDK